jgi:serine phosphatase RsbU (regulator of sigma subunit)
MEVVVAHIEPQKAAWADELARRVPFDPDGDDGVSAVVRTGRTEFIPCVPGEMIDAAMHRSVLAPSELEEVLSNLSLASVITAPLVTKRGVVGAMRFVSGDPGRTYDADDVALAEAAASRVADMLDNIWLTEQHRHISETLQRALLPPALPCIPGIDVAVRYWPAGTAVEAGGDFYDVFQTAPTRWSVLIGDVCGTGPDAAALTGIARHTVRAAARHGLDHRAILQWVNEAMRHSGRDRFCTAVYAELGLDEGGWTISTAAAGHPRPVLVRSTGGAELLGRPGSLLGVFEDIDLTVTDVSLDPGDVVICYTDGITDLPPPGGQTEHDVAELAARVAPGRSAAQIAEEIHDSVREQLRHDERSDDVALVVLRVC